MAYLGEGASTIAREADLILQLRRRLGIAETDTDQFSDASARDAWKQALRSVNKFWPSYLFGSFQTVAGQSDYSGLLPSGGKELIQVFWCAGLSCANYDFIRGYNGFDSWIGGFIGGEVNEAGYSYAVTPFTLASVGRHRTFLKKWFGGSGLVYDRDDVILIPQPGGVQTVRFVYTTNRFDSFGDITDDIPELADAAWAMALYVGCMTTSSGAGAITEVVGADGVKVKTGSGSQASKNADRYKSDFEDQTPLAPSPWLEGLRDC